MIIEYKKFPFHILPLKCVLVVCAKLVITYYQCELHDAEYNTTNNFETGVENLSRVVFIANYDNSL